MKKLLLLLFALPFFSSAQVNPLMKNDWRYPGTIVIGQNTAIEASSILELESTAKGFLVPRMTSAQKDAISSPATGLMIYQTDGTVGFYYYNGAAWVQAIGPAGATGTTGPSGADGATGAAGATGSAGATGATGATGGVSGITVGTTTITSGTTGSIGMNIGGIYSESISYRAQQSTPFGTAFGFAAMAGNSGYNNTAFGYNAGLGQTTGTDNLYFGYNAGFRNITGSRNIYLGGIAGDVLATNQSDNIFIGVGAGLHCSGSGNVIVGSGSQTGANLGNYNTILGHQAFFNASSTPMANVALGMFAGYGASGDYSVYIGALAGYNDNHFRSIALGNQAIPSQDNELMIGGADSYFGGTGASIGIAYVCIGNGNANTNPTAVEIRGTKESGTNQTSTANLTLQPSLGTGSGTGASLIVKIGSAVGVATDPNTATERFRVNTDGQTYSTYTRWKDIHASSSAMDVSGSVSRNADAITTTVDTRQVAIPIQYEPGSIITRLRVKFSGTDASTGWLVSIYKRDESSTGATAGTLVGAQQTMTGSGATITTYDVADETMSANTSYWVLLESEVPGGQTTTLYSVGVETSVRYH